MDKLLFGSDKIAKFLGLDSRIVRRAHAKGGFPTFKLGGRLCARPDDLRAWIDQKIKEGA